MSRNIFQAEKNPLRAVGGIVSAVTPKAAPEVNEAIDEVIEARKKALGLDSTQKLGEKFRFDHSLIGKYRRGQEGNPTKDKIEGFAKVLGVTPTDVINLFNRKRIDKARLRSAWLLEAFEAYENLPAGKRGEVTILVENLIAAIHKRSRD